jgi:hypothetical protein
MGLAEISLAGGDRKRALQLFRQSLSKEWPAEEESRRRSSQLKYATLLSDAGRRDEAISLLLSMIEQHGDNPAVGKKAADTVKAKPAAAAATPPASEPPAQGATQGKDGGRGPGRDARGRYIDPWYRDERRFPPPWVPRRPHWFK